MDGFEMKPLHCERARVQGKLAEESGCMGAAGWTGAPAGAGAHPVCAVAAVVVCASLFHGLNSVSVEKRRTNERNEGATVRIQRRGRGGGQARWLQRP